MQVSDDKVVSFHFSLTDADGKLIDSSADQEPLAYLHGRGNLVPGLENALAGKAAGETLTFEIELVEIREPTEEELAHGHVHGPGGHH